MKQLYKYTGQKKVFYFLDMVGLCSGLPFNNRFTLSDINLSEITALNYLLLIIRMHCHLTITMHP